MVRVHERVTYKQGLWGRQVVGHCSVRWAGGGHRSEGPEEQWTSLARTHPLEDSITRDRHCVVYSMTAVATQSHRPESTWRPACVLYYYHHECYYYDSLLVENPLIGLKH